MASTCFGPFGPSSESIRWDIAKVTVCVEIIYVTESHTAQHPVHTLQTEAHVATAQ
jgi:hypothetical protein